MTYHRVILAVLIVAIAAVLISAWTALAHDDAEWIMREPRYLTASGMHCCSPRDCSKAPPGAVELHPGGFKIAEPAQVWEFGNKGLYISIDRDYWWCVRRPLVVCLFVPGIGS